MKPWNRFLLPAILAFALPSVLIAQPSRNPLVGTWVLNVAKSTFKPGPAPQSETRTYEDTPDGMHHVTIHLVAADGSAGTETGSFKDDGKSYAFTGNPNLDAIAVTRLNVREHRTALMRNGKVVGHFTGIVSKDGKTYTATVTVQASGQTEHEVRVYVRQ